MRTMCSPAAVSAPKASVSATSPSSNGDERAVDHPLHRRDRRRRHRGDARRQLTDDGHQLPARVHRVEPADPHCLLSPDVAAREDHLERASAAEEMRESSRPAGAREDPHRHLGLAEDRTFAPVAQVERGEELGTTTSRRRRRPRRSRPGGCDADARTARRRRSARSRARARPAGWRGCRARRRASGRNRDRRSRTRRRARRRPPSS